MKRCLELASLGEGYTGTNPMVGSVIVAEGAIIGEGYHRMYGGPHAEVHAVESVRDTRLLAQSTLYVNLEPCSHHGKTPPCADLIIRSGIPKVVVGMTDPFGEVCGRGIGKLREAGIEVITGVLQKECEFLNRVFITYHVKKRPYIRLKWAQTTDGFLDNDRPDDFPPTWMTGPAARTLVHRMRGDASAILTGTTTVVRDNPSLTARESGKPDPIRIVIDRRGRISASARVFDRTAPSWLLTGRSDDPRTADKVFTLSEEAGIKEVIDLLYRNGVPDLFVEGGTTLFESLIRENLWDETHVFISPWLLSDLKGGSGTNGTPAPRIRGEVVQRADLGSVQYVVALNK